VVRWLLVIPGAVSAWYLTFVVGLFTHASAEQALCPADELISGLCANRGVRITLNVIVHAFIALSAIAVELTAVAIAPSSRVATAWAAFSAGSIVAIALGIYAKAYLQSAVAVVAGLLTAIAMTRRLRTR
jgi:hypothetical protein